VQAIENAGYVLETALTEKLATLTKAYEDADADLKKELGDVMWMVAEIATMFNMSLSNICEENITKLTDRKKRNVIIGEGDDR
jgi:NTP pyrophosphatase (non-canonical NTP hydrolase)